MNTFNRLQLNGSTRFFLFLLSLAVVVLAGCAGTGNFGRLVPDDNVKNAFETYQLPPNHTFYYSGPDASPKALIGIQNEFQLESNFWKPVELTQERLKRWFEKGGLSRRDYDLSRNGAEILAPDGRKIGIWYAMRNWRYRATIKMVDNNTVNVSTPIEQNESKNRRKMIP
jgi:hypothetical protein